MVWISAGCGLAWHGGVRQGTDPGQVRQGLARPGVARHGMDPGPVRRGKAWIPARFGKAG